MTRTLRTALTAAIASIAMAATSPVQAGSAPATAATVAAADQTLNAWMLETVRDHDASEDLRSAAQHALAQGLTDRDAPAILALIGDWQVPMDSRVWAVRLAGERDLPGAADALQASAGDDRYEIRAQVNRSLTRLNAVGVACMTSC